MPGGRAAWQFLVDRWKRGKSARPAPLQLGCRGHGWRRAQSAGGCAPGLRHTPQFGCLGLLGLHTLAGLAATAAVPVQVKWSEYKLTIAFPGLNCFHPSSHPTSHLQQGPCTLGPRIRLPATTYIGSRPGIPFLNIAHTTSAVNTFEWTLLAPTALCKRPPMNPTHEGRGGLLTGCGIRQGHHGSTAAAMDWQVRMWVPAKVAHTPCRLQCIKLQSAKES